MSKTLIIKYAIITVLCMLFSGFWSGMILSAFIFAVSEFFLPHE